MSIELNVTKELLSELKLASQKILARYDLGGSDLQASIQWEYKNESFVLLANDYFQWVYTGRRPRARKVPVEELIKWLKETNLKPSGKQTYSSLAFAIQNAIYKTGIKGKDIVTPITDVTIEILSEYIAEDLADQTAEEIARQMTFTLGRQD